MKPLRATKSTLEKATLVSAMESKVTLAMTTIRRFCLCEGCLYVCVCVCVCVCV